MIVSGFTAALDLDTHPLRNLIRPRCAERAKPGRSKPVLIMRIGFLACFHAISLERSRFSKIATSFFFVALKLLVSLISRLVACSPRIVVDTHTHTQNDYCNPRCACASRVNEKRGEGLGTRLHNKHCYTEYGSTCTTGNNYGRRLQAGREQAKPLVGRIRQQAFLGLATTWFPKRR